MEQTLLTKDQHKVLSAFAEEKTLGEFYLSGGTALAEYYLHHRDSDDLDFFCESTINPIPVESFVERMKQHLQATTVRMSRIHDRRLFYLTLPNQTELKLEFTRYPFPALENRNILNGIRVDSLRDITANKLAALIDRFEPKDFVDLYFLLQNRSLEEIRKDTEQKFGFTISPIFLGSELAKVARIESLPNMRLPLTVADLKTFFTDQARQLKPSIIEVD